MSSAGRVRAQHTEWLAALDGDGPWLTVPALNERLKDGLVPTTPDQNQYLKTAHTAWTTAHPRDEATAQAAWVCDLVQDWLGWGDHAQFSDLDRFSHTHTIDASRRVTTTPGFALLPVPKSEADEKTQPVLLGFTYPTGTSLTRRVGDGWPTTPIDRAVHALRDADVPLGLVTDGRWWALVWAPRQTTPGYALWSTDLLLDDELLRSAFTTLLSRHRSLAVAETESLRGLFEKSQDSQEDITETLSQQVRKAVELLVDSFSAANTTSDGAYFTDPTTAGGRVSDDDIYQAAVTLVMRLVFMLAAEERDLLRADDDFYTTAYSVGALADRLIDRANRDGEDLLRETASAFPQLLATSRVIHDGVRHPRLNLPGYGGSVFDPTRFPWLEDAPTAPGLGPITVDDRTMLHILRGLTRWEGRRLSYRTLDVEQIGYAYEGLLDHTAITATEPVLGIRGKNEPEIPLTEFEALAVRGDKAVTDWLKKTADLSAAQIKTALAARDQTVDAATRQRLEAACNSDTAVADRIQPWLTLLRTDPRTGLPIVINPGTTYVTASSARGDTGTHYTPKFLAEDVVKTTLDAVLHSPGPLDSNDPTTWQPIHPEKIITLKVADIAMGSGAFLVAAIRYMADTLLQALELVPRDTLTTPALIDLWDTLHAPDTDRPDWDTSHDDNAILAAQRLIAARCIYGVDINPMAVEMAKLSIWLVTASRNQPFSFLDHRLLAGDSLLGLHDIRQLENLHLKPERGKAKFGATDGTLFNFTDEVQRALARITELRTQIDKQHVVDLRSVEEQERLHHEAQQLTADLALVADGITAASLAAAKQGGNYDKVLDAKTGLITRHIQDLFSENSTPTEKADARDAIRTQADAWLALDLPDGGFSRDPQHWPLEYPEVKGLSSETGFDALVGNPPFLGGKKISGACGGSYLQYLKAQVGKGIRGNADLVAYFFLRAAELGSGGSVVGLLSTNTIAQGETREVALGGLVADGWTIYSAVRSKPWPSRKVALEYAQVHLASPDSLALPPADKTLDGVRVERITAYLTDGSQEVEWVPLRLVANLGIAHQGVIYLGEGFLLSDDERRAIAERDPASSRLLRPLLTGQDINSTVGARPGRWIFDTRGLIESELAEFPELNVRLRRMVRPEREKSRDSGYREKWWLWARSRPALWSALNGCDSALALAGTSSTLQPVLFDLTAIPAYSVVVVADPDLAMLGALASSIHWMWALREATTLKTDITYSPPKVFDTFPWPTPTERVRTAAQLVLDARMVWQRRGFSLTQMYNEMNSRDSHGDDVRQLRDAHHALDSAVLAAYGWSDLDIGHEIVRVRGRWRFTLDLKSHAPLLGRLLELNHQRHAEEVKAGLVDEKGRPLRKAADTKRKPRGGVQASAGGVQGGLFADPSGEQGDLLTGDQEDGS